MRVTCYITFCWRHSDSTETVLRRPSKVRAGDIIVLGITILQFLLLFNCYFPSWPFSGYLEHLIFIHQTGSDMR